MKPLVILGAGGHGREILDIVRAVNAEDPTFELLGFLDDTGGEKEVLARLGAPVLGGVEDLERMEAWYLIGLGDPEHRRRMDAMAASWGREPAVAIHPSATLGSDVSIGAGVVIAAGARVTTNVRLGRHVHLNVNATVSHDCRLGDYVTVSPGAHVNGRVVVEDGALIGAGAVLKDRVRIGSRAIVGAGAVVVRDLPALVTAVGVPAAPLSERGTTPARGGPPAPAKEGVR